MKKTNHIREIAVILTIAIMLSLAGCGTNAGNTQPSANPQSEQTPAPATPTVKPAEPADIPEETPVPTEMPEETPTLTEEPSSEEIESETIPTEPPIIEEPVDEYGLTEQQRNSVSMLYHLAITAEEIRTAKDNRLILDDIYTSLRNDLNPGAIDETTQEHLKSLRDIIYSYLDISVKRDRLQYIYNQNKAATIRKAVPNPLAILSLTNSMDWKRLVTGVAYTVVDSFTNYKQANDTADQEFLMSGWELDDEETETIRKNRDRAYDYMIDIVQEYGFDGKLTLNDKAITTFAEICAIESFPEKTRRLEAEEKTYCLLGNYWLELADCYYETGKYQKCLDAIEKYDKLATGIYRTDYNYVQILPKAIVAAQNIYSGDEYIIRIEKFANDILENTSTDEWSIRYFAAEVFLDLYARTDNKQYAETAYNIAYDNVTILLQDQRDLNTAYLSDVEEVTAKEPDYRFMTETEKKEAEKEYKAEQKRVKAYNKAQKEDRETALPPISEPLLLNCELLFALADELKITTSEKKDIEAILQTNTNGIFLVQPVNVRYSFSSSVGSDNVELTKSEIRIPVVLLTNEAKITVVITDGNKTTTCDDCVVKSVERKGDKIQTFTATVTSNKLKSYDWTADSKVTVKIEFGGSIPVATYMFKVTEYKEWIGPIPDKVVFGKA